MKQSSSPDYDVGYGKPPAKNQFKKGQSGNPRGRPKQDKGISITEALDEKQYGRNGEVISNREAIVIRLLKDASQGNQKAFAKFLTLMIQSGLLRNEVPALGGQIIRFPIDRRNPPSPKTYAVWLREKGRHEEANAIDPL
jgi:Family of unknown function (DUF5681)